MDNLPFYLWTQLKAITYSYEEKRIAQIESGDYFKRFLLIEESRMLRDAVLSLCGKYTEYMKFDFDDTAKSFRILAVPVMKKDIINDLCSIIRQRALSSFIFMRDTRPICKILEDNYNLMADSVFNFINNYVIQFSSEMVLDKLESVCQSFLTAYGNKRISPPDLALVRFAQWLLTNTELNEKVCCTSMRHMYNNTIDNSKGHYFGDTYTTLTISESDPSAYMAGHGHIGCKETDNYYEKVTDNDGAYGCVLKASHSKSRNIMNNASLRNRPMTPISQTDEDGANNEEQGHIDAHNEAEKRGTHYEEAIDDGGACGCDLKYADSELRNISNEASLDITLTRGVMVPFPQDHIVGANNGEEGHIDGNNQGCPTFKLVIVGDRGTGKTTFMTRQLTGLPSIGVDAHARIYNIEFATSSGPIRFNCWDIHGLPNVDVYMIRADCAIVMFDVTNPQSFFNIRRWRHGISRVCGDIPIVVCGNKVDRLNDRLVTPRAVARSMRRAMLQYYEVCARSNYNYEKPFLYLSRQLVNSNLAFVHAPALAAPEVQVDLEAQERNELEFETALAQLQMLLNLG